MPQAWDALEDSWVKKNVKTVEGDYSKSKVFILVMKVFYLE